MELVYATTDGREAALVPPSEALLLEPGAICMHDEEGQWRQIAYYGERSAWELEPGVSLAGLGLPATAQTSLQVRAVKPLELWTRSGDDDSFDVLIGKGSALKITVTDRGISLVLDGKPIAGWSVFVANAIPDDFWSGPSGTKLGEEILIRTEVADVAASEVAVLGPRHRLSALAGRSN
jgi:hypothetical protein